MEEPKIIERIRTMKHEEFETQMFSCVNKNCKMKELDRQENERAAQEEYRFICKCKKINAVIGIIVFMAFSAVMSVVWLVLESPDLAITEAAVGAGVTSLLFFVTLKKIHAMKEEGEADE